MTRIRPTTFLQEGDDPREKTSTLKAETKRAPLDTAKAAEISQASGFTSRSGKDESNGGDGTSVFDARSLRRTGRSAQLNISIKPGTKERFWRFTQDHGFAAGEDALVVLLDAVANQPE